MAEAIRSDSDDTHNSNTEKCNQSSPENLSDLSEILRSCSQELFFSLQQNEKLSVRLQKALQENSVRC